MRVKKQIKQMKKEWKKKEKEAKPQNLSTNDREANDSRRRAYVVNPLGLLKKQKER